MELTHLLSGRAHLESLALQEVCVRLIHPLRLSLKPHKVRLQMSVCTWNLSVQLASCLRYAEAARAEENALAMLAIVSITGLTQAANLNRQVGDIHGLYIATGRSILATHE